MVIIKRALILSVLITLTACVTNPHKVEVKQHDDMYLSCSSLNYELTKAERYKKDARKDDRFMFKYMLPLNAIMSTYNIMSAENKAIKRIKYLNEIKTQKGCNPMMPQDINVTNTKYTPTNDFSELGVAPGGSFPPPPGLNPYEVSQNSYADTLMQFENQKKQPDNHNAESFTSSYPKLNSFGEAPAYNSNHKKMRDYSIASSMKKRRPVENDLAPSDPTDLNMILSNPAGDSMGL